MHEGVHTGGAHMGFTEVVHVQSINSAFVYLLEQDVNGNTRPQI